MRGTGQTPKPLWLAETEKLWPAWKLEGAELAAGKIDATVLAVKLQEDAGIDIVSDGEQSKASFQAYATDRLSGIEPIAPKPGERHTRENAAFKTFYPGGAHPGSAQAKWACTGPIRYTGAAAVVADIANLRRALQELHPVDAFMPSVSPSSCAGMMENRYYQSDEEHVLAVAEAMRRGLIS